MTVTFWTFIKKLNSTAQPAAADAVLTVDCKLKDQCGVLRPVLEIYNTPLWNPSALNYAEIPTFGRYYYIDEWNWANGHWDCSLSFDAMASWRSGIRSQYKYVLRASARYNDNIVDTFYPATADAAPYYYSTQSFYFVQDYDQGTYILGVANQMAAGAGAISYYVMSSSQIRSLVYEMLPPPLDPWSQSFTSMTDVLYRSIYGPFDYIKSCKWFPISLTAPGSTVSVAFGNYTSSAQGIFLDNDTSTWGSMSRTLQLPATWATAPARTRVNPYCHVYIQFNPWGIIELNPQELSDAVSVRITQTVDFISGESLIKIYKVRADTTEAFLTQAVAQLAQDINLSSASINAGSLISGALSVASGVAAVATAGGAAAAIAPAISTLGALGDTMLSSVPAASGSVGQHTGGARLMDGIATLMVTGTVFPAENIVEFGRPLCEPVFLNTLPGYIKCADGDVDISGAMREEVEQIGQYLMGGFYNE